MPIANCDEIRSKQLLLPCAAVFVDRLFIPQNTERHQLFRVFPAPTTISAPSGTRTAASCLTLWWPIISKLPTPKESFSAISSFSWPFFFFSRRQLRSFLACYALSIRFAAVSRFTMENREISRDFWFIGPCLPFFPSGIRIFVI